MSAESIVFQLIKSLFRRYERRNLVHPTSRAFWAAGIGIGCGVGWGPNFGLEVISYVGSDCGVGCLVLGSLFLVRHWSSSQLLLEISHIGKCDVDVPYLETCDDCGGTGTKPNNCLKTCAECGGRGQKLETQRTPFGIMSQMSKGACGSLLTSRIVLKIRYTFI
ncbi:hypothetical protein ACS0TY_027017 [Phlomoides rotata]